MMKQTISNIKFANSQKLPHFFHISELDNMNTGLRNRKKQALRQQLSDTATGMFLTRGFENVRITEIATACNVSEKTVYNYFPVKESLLLDREAYMTESLRMALSEPTMLPVDAMVLMLNEEVRALTDSLKRKKDWVNDASLIQQFFNIIENTPSVRSYQYDIMDRLTTVAAVIIAKRVGLVVESPEPQIIAEVLIGLWKVQQRALRRFTNGKYKPDEMAILVNAEIRSAAYLIDIGVGSLKL
jgi:AcrR family transcriptional regulator